jgi:hypothetical protein
MSGDERDRDERPRRSWREIDRMRDGGDRGDEHARPRDRAGQARVRQATGQYLKQVDRLFAKEAGGAESAALAAAVRDAHGTEGLAAACHAYRDALGIPRDAALLSLFLDSGDAGLVAPALEALLEAHREGRLEVKSGLKSQLRLLAQDRDDAVAEPAEELLERL